MRYLFMLVVLIISACSNDQDDGPPDPIIGKWSRNFYQFKGLPGSHKNYENLMIPSHYVKGTAGIYDEDVFEITFNRNGNFSRKLVHASRGTYADKGTWKIAGNELVVNSESSANNEIFTLHSNSGTSMAIYQNQRWLLLPDVVLDTLTSQYYDHIARQYTTNTPSRST